jgi:large subunit ribosomal protein L19
LSTDNKQQEGIGKEEIIKAVESQYLRERPLPDFAPGDTIKVWVKIREADKERLQAFEGLVLSRKGKGLGESFTVRRVVSGVGIERTFLYHSPLIDHIDVVRHGKVRRAKLYYIREKKGKEARIKEKKP